MAQYHITYVRKSDLLLVEVIRKGVSKFHSLPQDLPTRSHLAVPPLTQCCFGGCL